LRNSNPYANPIADVNNIMQDINIYSYCVNNPVTHTDKSGLAVTFVQINGRGYWQFLNDNKLMNVTFSGLDIFIPFFSTSMYFGNDRLASAFTEHNYKTVSRHIVDDALGTIASSLGVYSEVAQVVGDSGKFAKVAGRVSVVISAANFANEVFGDVSYTNQIVGMEYGRHFGSSSFEETLASFTFYSALVKDLVDYGAITYETNWWGEVDSYSINRELHDKYFDDLGVSHSEYRNWVKEMTVCD